MGKEKKIELTIKQLSELLEEQRYLCRQHFEDVWKESKILKAIKEVEENDEISNQIHWLRDRLPDAPKPEEFNILKKYFG